MEGIPEHFDHRGITPRSFEHVFQEVAVRSNTKFLVRASYLEIYNDSVHDLLNTSVFRVSKPLIDDQWKPPDSSIP